MECGAKRVREGRREQREGKGWGEPEVWEGQRRGAEETTDVYIVIAGYMYVSNQLDGYHGSIKQTGIACPHIYSYARFPKPHFKMSTSVLSCLFYISLFLLQG